MKIAYIVTHPQLGTSVMANPGETPDQAVQRYNSMILGFNPGDSMPVVHPYNPTWTPIYSKEQLSAMKYSIEELPDPDTREMISLDAYEADYNRYVIERKQPLPADVWQN